MKFIEFILTMRSQIAINYKFMKADVSEIL